MHQIQHVQNVHVHVASIVCPSSVCTLSPFRLNSLLPLPAERSRLDPNDPRNSELLRLIESVPSSAELENYFRLIDVDDVERFVRDEVMENDRRFTLLQLRDQGVCE